MEHADLIHNKIGYFVCTCYRGDALANNCEQKTEAGNQRGKIDRTMIKKVVTTHCVFKRKSSNVHSKSKLA